MDTDEEGLFCQCVCACKTIQFKVRYRNKDEDLIDWMDNAVTPAMAKAHFEASPLCTETKGDLQMPVPEGAQGIGLRVVS